MAKKDNEALYQAFLADLKTIAPEVEEVIAKNEKATAKLKESVLARSDYNAQSDALRKEREDMQTFLQTERQKIEGWTKWYADTSGEYAATVDELKKYRDEFGDLTDAGQRREAARHGMSKEEFESKLSEEITKRDTAAIKFVDDLTDLKIEHRQRFGERLNTEEVFKIAGEKQLPLDVAYDVYIADRVEDLRKKDFDDAVKKAREEGAAEALAKHNLPVMSSDSSIMHVLDQSKEIPRDSNSRVSAAVTAFLNRNKT